MCFDGIIKAYVDLQQKDRTVLPADPDLPGEQAGIPGKTITPHALLQSSSEQLEQDEKFYSCTSQTPDMEERDLRAAKLI